MNNLSFAITDYVEEDLFLSVEDEKNHQNQILQKENLQDLKLFLLFSVFYCFVN